MKENECPDDYMEECNVLIQIDINKVNIADVFEAEAALRKLGISFDTGSGFGFRDWELDSSLTGPMNVYFKGFKDEKKKANNENVSNVRTTV
jgi:hypothetical protein